MNTQLRYLPPNATHLLQPADSFVIQKIKDAWSARWEAHKAKLLAEVVSTETYGTKSGALPNSGKSFFLMLAVESVRAVNKQKDQHGMSYARKAMLRCVLGKQDNGLWDTKQLFPYL